MLTTTSQAGEYQDASCLLILLPPEKRKSQLFSIKSSYQELKNHTICLPSSHQLQVGMCVCDYGVCGFMCMCMQCVFVYTMYTCVYCVCVHVYMCVSTMSCMSVCIHEHILALPCHTDVFASSATKRVLSITSSQSRGMYSVEKISREVPSLLIYHVSELRILYYQTQDPPPRNFGQHTLNQSLRTQQTIMKKVLYILPYITF